MNKLGVVKMFIIVFRAWNGQKCEIVNDEEKAKKRYKELKEIYSKIKLLKVEEEISI